MSHSLIGLGSADGAVGFDGLEKGVVSPFCLVTTNPLDTAGTSSDAESFHFFVVLILYLLDAHLVDIYLLRSIVAEGLKTPGLAMAQKAARIEGRGGARFVATLFYIASNPSCHGLCPFIKL